MTPTPRSLAGSSVTSRPCRIIFPVFGCSRPAMILRMVVFPLPDAPSNTRISPSATSSEMFSSTPVLPKRLLTPITRVAIGGALSLDVDILCSSTSFCFAFNGCLSVYVKPVAGKKEHAENEKREECQNDGNGVRGFYLPFVEFSEDIKRGGLCASGEVTGNENGGTEFTDGAGES